MPAAQAPAITPAPRTNDDGLTLAEMVVALGIIMIVLVSSLGVFLTVSKAQQQSEGTDRAIQLANGRIERIRQLDWADIGFYSDTFNASATAATGYTNYLPFRDGSTTARETTVPLGPTDPNTGTNRLLPVETTTEAENAFTVYTTITWGTSTALGLPRESGSTGDTAVTNGNCVSTAECYSFKRVRVTVIWRASGNGVQRQAVSETWFSPDGTDEAPPGLPVSNES